MSNSLYLITGPSGSGKTSLSNHLTAQGYQSIEADSAPGICYYVNKVGKPVPYPPQADAAWWLNHHYIWELDRLRKLIGTLESTSSPIFLCGNAGNIKKAWDMFKGAYYLDVPPDILIKRIKNTTGNENFGQRIDDKDQLIRWVEPFKQEMLELGAVPIDATQPIGAVAVAILAHIKAKTAA